MNQTEAANLLGVSVSTVSRICSGERRPSLDLMYVVEGVFGWTIEDQANEIRCDAYYDGFRKRMEAAAYPTERIGTRLIDEQEALDAEPGA